MISRESKSVCRNLPAKNVFDYLYPEDKFSDMIPATSTRKKTFKRRYILSTVKEEMLRTKQFFTRM